MCFLHVQQLNVHYKCLIYIQDGIDIHLDDDIDEDALLASEGEEIISITRWDENGDEQLISKEEIEIVYPQDDLDEFDTSQNESFVDPHDVGDEHAQTHTQYDDLTEDTSAIDIEVYNLPYFIIRLLVCIYVYI